MALYEKPVRLLMHDMVADLGLKKGEILPKDAKKNLVVVKLKVSRGYDRVVGQLLRYMAWIASHQAEPGQKVRGIIVARDISEDLLLACSTLPPIELFDTSSQLHFGKSIRRK